MAFVSRNPSWWLREYDGQWEAARAAFRGLWERTPDLIYTAGQHENSATMYPPTASRPVDGDFDRQEPAFRFGFGAQLRYGKEHDRWNARLAEQLHRDWAATGREEWNQNLNAIRRGWTFASQRRPTPARPG